MSLLPLAYWVHHMDQFLIRFGDNIGIRYYGLSYVLGFVVGIGLLVFYSRRKQSRLSEAEVSDLSTYLVLGVVLGGRVGYFLLYEAWRSFLTDPLAILRIWDGGMSFHGGCAGVGLALWLFSKRHKHPFLHVADLVCSVAPAGLFFGRLANFINGELWGKITDVRWAVIFPQSAAPDLPIAYIPPRHPSQLYEAALEGLLLLAWLQWRVWRHRCLLRFEGRLAGEFLLGYALARMLCEQFREPDVGISFILGLSRGTFYSSLMVAGGLLLLWKTRRLEAGK